MLNIYQKLLLESQSVYFVIQPSGQISFASNRLFTLQPEQFLRLGVDAFDFLLGPKQRLTLAEMMEKIFQGVGESRRLTLLAKNTELNQPAYLQFNFKQLKTTGQTQLLLEVKDRTAEMREQQQLKAQEHELSIINYLIAQRRQLQFEEDFYQLVVELIREETNSQAVSLYLYQAESKKHILHAQNGTMCSRCYHFPRQYRTKYRARVGLVREFIDIPGAICQHDKHSGVRTALRVPINLRQEHLGWILLVSKDIQTYDWQVIKLVVNITHFVANLLMTDILQWRQQQSEAVTKAVFYQSSEPMLVLNVKGQVIASNDAMQRLLVKLNPSSQDFLLSLKGLSANKFKHFLKELARQHQASIRIRLLDNHIYELYGNRLDRGLSRNYLCSLRDVSQWLNRERYLEARNIKLQELDRMKDQFLSLVSHELRSPLTVLRGHLSIIGQQVSIQPSEEYQAMNQSLNRLTRLVDDILDLTQLEYGKVSFELQNINLSSLLESVYLEVKPALRAKNIIWQVKLGLAEVINDRDRLQQVIINLVQNAIKNVGQQGIIEVTVRKRGVRAILTIKDNGRGIAKIEQSRIFGSFYKSDPQQVGVGLGLFIVGQLVKRMRGTVSVKSQLGQGAKFIVNIPTVLKA